MPTKHTRLVNKALAKTTHDRQALPAIVGEGEIFIPGEIRLVVMFELELESLLAQRATMES